MSVDVLAVGAHPDDVELGVGGLIHKLISTGHTVGILDLTRGEMSTRGSPEERLTESENAARILGVTQRENARLPDGALANTHDQRRSVIPFIRRFRPTLLIIPMDTDRHPDHCAAHDLMRAAAFFSGLARIETGQEPYRPARVYGYHPYDDSSAPPALLVDISDHFEAKLAALRAYASQFHNPQYPGKQTHVASPEFWESIRTRAAYWGGRVGVAYGEPLFADGPVRVPLPPGLENTA